MKNGNRAITIPGGPSGPVRTAPVNVSLEGTRGDPVHRFHRGTPIIRPHKLIRGGSMKTKNPRKREKEKNKQETRVREFTGRPRSAVSRVLRCVQGQRCIPEDRGHEGLEGLQVLCLVPWHSRRRVILHLMSCMFPRVHGGCSCVAPTCGGALKQCYVYKPDVRVSTGVIRQGREPTDRLVKSRPGRRYRGATSRVTLYPTHGPDGPPTNASPPPPVKPVHLVMTRKAARFINQGVRGGACANHSATGY